MILATSLESVDNFVKVTGVNYTLVYIVLAVITVLVYSIIAIRINDKFLKIFYGLLSIGILGAIFYSLNKGSLPSSVQFIVVLLVILTLINLVDYLISSPKETKVVVIDSPNDSEIEEDYYREYRMPNHLNEQLPEKKKKSLL